MTPNQSGTGFDCLKRPKSQIWPKDIQGDQERGVQNRECRLDMPVCLSYWYNWGWRKTKCKRQLIRVHTDRDAWHGRLPRRSGQPPFAFARPGAGTSGGRGDGLDPGPSRSWSITVLTPFGQPLTCRCLCESIARCRHSTVAPASSRVRPFGSPPLSAKPIRFGYYRLDIQPCSTPRKGSRATGG